METLNSRHQKEVEIINNLHFITIKDLASVLAVSEMTVRRDCAFLTNLGLIKQVYGGITSLASGKAPNYLVDSELKKNTFIKEKIANKAIGLLSKDEVFFFRFRDYCCRNSKTLTSQFILYHYHTLLPCN